MSQPIPHQDRTVKPPNGISGEQKRVDSLIIQTSGLSFAGDQMSPVASSGYNSADPLLPAYNDLIAPASAPKRISRKPVGGGTIKVQAQAQAQAQAQTVPASGASNYTHSSMISNVPGYTPSSPTSDVPAYEPTSPVTDVPTYASLTSSPSPPSSPNTVHSPVFQPLSATSTASTAQNSVFSPITTSSTSTTIPPTISPPVQGTGPYPPLSKPIVIPQVLNHTPKNTIGKPFTRAYANILAQYSISQEAFLAFLDELNIDYIGHVGFEYTRKAGKVIHLAGNFDPTGITKMVGKTVSMTAELGEMAYIKGPMSKKKWYLNHANEDIFKPRGLKVSIMSGKEVRQLLRVEPKFPLCAPLMMGWVVPSKELLLKGQRSKCRVAARQICQLLPRVHDLVLACEANDALLTDSKLADRQAAKSVRNWQVGSEVQHELWRGQALSLYAAAKSAVTQKEKEKLEKKARALDKEPIHTEKIGWLVIWNADGVESAVIAPNPGVTV